MNEDLTKDAREAEDAKERSAILKHERTREITNNVVLAALFVVFAATAAHCSSCGDERALGAVEPAPPPE